MDFFEVLKLRRSVRSFTEKQVSKADVERILQAAVTAPSAGNIQPWEFVVIRNTQTKRRLADAALDQSFIAEASVVIVVCANEMRSEAGYGTRGVNLYCIQDTAAATENILLAACALGLGACWVGAFQEKEVKKVLCIPEGLRPVAIVPIGYAAERPIERTGRPLRNQIIYETFDKAAKIQSPLQG